MSAAVHIDTLAFEDMSPEEARRAAGAFEAELTALLTEHGLPEGKTAEEIEEIDLGELPRTMQTPEGIGQELAKALFSELWR